MNLGRLILSAALAAVLVACSGPGAGPPAGSTITMVTTTPAMAPAPAPAMAPTPQPGPAPAPEPPARDYLVFFDFDKSDVRPDAADTLARVVAAMGELKSSAVSLVGHADRSGPTDYTQALSERRAASVQDYLVQGGIAAAAISTEGRGESDPRVPTPDGVREQENRRVEIRIE